MNHLESFDLESSAWIAFFFDNLLLLLFQH